MKIKLSAFQTLDFLDMSGGLEHTHIAAPVWSGCQWIILHTVLLEEEEAKTTRPEGGKKCHADEYPAENC